jgi:hypothetical protein
MVKHDQAWTRRVNPLGRGVQIFAVAPILALMRREKN